MLFPYYASHGHSIPIATTTPPVPTSPTVISSREHHLPLLFTLQPR
jgi:hypothetical protein